MLANKTNLTNIITNLTTSYPSQSPITFTSNQHTVHYLDLALSLNHYTMWYHKVHYQVYQKLHHKHMYPHPKHIFTGIIKAETIWCHRFSAIVDDYNFIMSEVSDYFQLVARTHWTSFHFTYSPLYTFTWGSQLYSFNSFIRCTLSTPSLYSRQSRKSFPSIHFPPFVQQIQSSSLTQNGFEANDDATIYLYLMVTMIRHSMIASFYPLHRMIIRFVIRGNGFIEFCQFIQHFLETLLPSETFRRRTVVNVETWYIRITVVAQEFLPF